MLFGGNGGINKERNPELHVHHQRKECKRKMYDEGIDTAAESRSANVVPGPTDRGTAINRPNARDAWYKKIGQRGCV
jgi:hypothetical protein